MGALSSLAFVVNRLLNDQYLLFDLVELSSIVFFIVLNGVIEIHNFIIVVFKSGLLFIFNNSSYFGKLFTKPIHSIVICSVSNFVIADITLGHSR